MSHPTTSPILLPEILSNIARYIPLFKPHAENTNHFDSNYSFTPENLYRCLLVSRLWYQCFLPHLYHYFVGPVMTPACLPRHVFLKHRLLFRRVILYVNTNSRKNNGKGHHIIDLPANLLGLSVVLVDETPPEYLRLLLTTCGPRLRELTWSRLVSMSAPDTPLEFLGGFSALEDLVLVQRHFTSDQLRTILLGCSQTLRSLTMHGVSGYGQEAFFNDADQPPLELTALRGLYLKLDRPQSRAVVHLPRICPALEVLQLNVNLEDFDFDLQVMVDYCQRSCPQLHTMHYYERSHQYQRRGYYPEPELYAHLFKHSARHLRSALISLPNGLDSHMLDALQSQAATLEHIELRMKRGSTLDTSMLALLLEKTTALKSLVVEEANFGVQDFDRLCHQPWACQNLKTIIVKGYFTKREQWDRVRPGFDPRVADEIDAMFQDITLPEEPFVYSDMAHRMYEGDGQGWHLQQGLGEWCYEQAAQERAIKKKLFRHMYSSGLHQVSRITLNSTDLFAEEQPPPAATYRYSHSPC